MSLYPSVKSDGVFITVAFWLFVILWVLPWNVVWFIVDIFKYDTTPGRR